MTSYAQCFRSPALSRVYALGQQARLGNVCIWDASGKDSNTESINILRLNKFKYRRNVCGCSM